MTVKTVEEADIGEWSDDHELNSGNTPVEVFRKYFNKGEEIMNTDAVTNFESIKQIDSSKLTDKDTLVITVDVGNMPSHKIREYLENLKQQFREQEVIPEYVKLIITYIPFSISVTSDED